MPKNILELSRSQLKATQRQFLKTSSSMLLSCIVRCMSLSRRTSWIGAKKLSEGDARTNPKRSSEMQEHRTGERKKERSIKHHVAMLMPFPSDESLRPRTNPMRGPSSTLKKFLRRNPAATNTTPAKSGVQENLWFRGRLSPNGTRKQERSPNGASDCIRPVRIDGVHPSFRTCLFGGIL